ncbi:MAG: hypothetical protein Q7S99_03080 [Parvibaculum sp.]|nr:hypothetical protein [Parvibaculum sp.]
MNSYAGMQIFEDIHMTEPKEDWSRVRSPARARRRRRKHRQNIEIVYVPKKDVIQIGNRLYMHPAMAAELRHQISVRA